MCRDHRRVWQALWIVLLSGWLCGCGGEKVPPGDGSAGGRDAGAGTNAPRAAATSRDRAAAHAATPAREKSGGGKAARENTGSKGDPDANRTGAGDPLPAAHTPTAAGGGDAAVPDPSASGQGQAPLPVVQSSCEKGGDLPCKVAILPFRNRAADPEAGEFLRRPFANALMALGYDAAPPSTVDYQLRQGQLHGPLVRGEKVPLERICQLLKVDGVVGADVIAYGRVTGAPRPTHQATLKAELLGCQDRRQVWVREVTVSDQGGEIALDPSGQALNAVKGFIDRQHAPLLAVAIKLGQEITRDLPRPKMKGEPPPRITLMVHNGANRFLHPGQSLRVAVIGEAGMTGFWDVGGNIVNLPLREKLPGFYVGEFAIKERDRAIDVLPVARLMARSRVTTHWVDILGGVNIGRLNPLPQVIHKDLTLTAANSPYLVNPIVTVRPGATLTLEPGTVVWMRGKGVIVKGTIVAQGEPEAPIRLLSAAPESPWDGIFLDQTRQPNSLSHLFISGARYGINAHDAKVAIQGSTLRDNVWGMTIEGGELALRDSRIYNSERSGVLIRGGRGVIAGCRIAGNRGGGIHLWRSQVTIEGNDIDDNTPWAIRNQEAGEAVKAPRNWWGRPHAEEIPLQGVVDIEPLSPHPLTLPDASPRL
ncbi:MAG: right-handed parallel beta-helix repeat-containing protein [Magnetococcales bacterium]|nr:right-handed parallel beta-helix repeat-containing protein [Magnetococcales bacterium]